jgi:hypothetical protein
MDHCLCFHMPPVYVLQAKKILEWTASPEEAIEVRGLMTSAAPSGAQA